MHTKWSISSICKWINVSLSNFFFINCFIITNNSILFSYTVLKFNATYKSLSLFFFKLSNQFIYPVLVAKKKHKPGYGINSWNSFFQERKINSVNAISPILRFYWSFPSWNPVFLLLPKRVPIFRIGGSNKFFNTLFGRIKFNKTRTQLTIFLQYFNSNSNSNLYLIFI